MRPREAGKHDFGERISILAFSGVFVFRRGHFRSVRVSGAAAGERPDQIHSLVIFAIPAGGNRHRMGDVPILPLTLSTLP